MRDGKASSTIAKKSSMLTAGAQSPPGRHHAPVLADDHPGRAVRFPGKAALKRHHSRPARSNPSCRSTGFCRETVLIGAGACIVASNRRTSRALLAWSERPSNSCSLGSKSAIDLGIAEVARLAEPLLFFLVRLGKRVIAVLDRASRTTKPRRKLHQPRGQPHALSRVDKSGAAFEFLGFRTAGAIEITRRFPRRVPFHRERNWQKPGELASRSLNDTVLASLARFSDIDTPHTTDSIARLVVRVQHAMRSKRTHRVAGKRFGCRRGHSYGANEARYRSIEKGAAVAGGDKVITGRRQTEWDRSHSMSRRWTLL